MHTIASLENIFDKRGQEIYLRFTNKDNVVVGEFKERNGKLIFEGNLSDSGEIFVNYILEAFNNRVQYLASKQDKL